MMAVVEIKPMYAQRINYHEIYLDEATRQVNLSPDDVADGEHAAFGNAGSTRRLVMASANALLAHTCSSGAELMHDFIALAAPLFVMLSFSHPNKVVFPIVDLPVTLPGNKRAMDDLVGMCRPAEPSPSNDTCGLVCSRWRVVQTGGQWRDCKGI